MCRSCPASDRKRGERYQNPHIKDIRRTLFDFILWKLRYYDDKSVQKKAPEGFRYPVEARPYDPNCDFAEWINHSTYLIRSQGVHFLTDPIWSFRCSPSRFLGPKRRHEPPKEIAELPKIDYVLISHNHYDHLDKTSVKELHRQFPDIVWIVPIGVKKWFEKQGIRKVREIDWWHDAVFTLGNAKFRITAVPTQHFSGRSMWDSNKTLWNGYVVESLEQEVCKRFYFVGDTGYNPIDFKAIGEAWPHMDLSLIPIGTYVPRKFMSPVHIEPHHSVKIHKEVNSKFSLGMHWKTFHLSDEPMHQPPFDLLSALQEEGLQAESFLPIEPGQRVNW